MGVTAAAVGSFLTTNAGTIAAVGSGIAGASALYGALNQPKPPGVKAPIPMPDQQAQQQAKQTSIIDQLARRGRASTILTGSGTDTKLGG